MKSLSECIKTDRAELEREERKTMQDFLVSVCEEGRKFPDSKEPTWPKYKKLPGKFWMDCGQPTVLVWGARHKNKKYRIEEISDTDTLLSWVEYAEKMKKYQE